MTTLEAVYAAVIATQTVIDEVGVTNVHLQHNDQDKNNFAVSENLITFSEIASRRSYVKVLDMFQFTVWSKDKIKANEISNAIIAELDMVRNEHYNYSRIPGVAGIYDFELGYFGNAITVNVVSRKF